MNENPYSIDDNSGQRPEKKESELSPEDRILGLGQQINKLKTQRQEALASIVIETRKKKKGKKEEVQPLELELPQNSEARARSIEFVKGDKNDFQFDYKDEQGNETMASAGDLISDIQWGVYYDLNHEVKSQAHRREYSKFRQQYVEAFYQTQIEELENEQSLIELLEIEHVENRDHYLAEAYQNVYETLQQHKEGKESMQAGFLLEKMVNGLLTKISIDLGSKYGFQVEQATVVDDVELKIDLIIKIADKNRGVGVEETTKSKGIQLTLIKRDNAKFKRKQQQVDKVKAKLGRGAKLKVDDLVLIQVDVDNRDASGNYEKWAKQGKPVGGPEKLFNTKTIVNQFLAGIFQDTDLDLNDEINVGLKNDLWEYFERR